MTFFSQSGFTKGTSEAPKGQIQLTNGYRVSFGLNKTTKGPL